jgi:tetratricopeptide (TPR) repeat protein
MTAPGGGPESSQIRIDAHAEGQAEQYIAGRDQNFFVGPPPLAATMRTLPRDVAAFTGRDTELQQLITAASGVARVVAIHTVDGMPGVGKTALVTRAAHLLAGDFPDGQLFVSLHAHTPGMQPANPGEVLADLLACTGMAPREIPTGLEGRAERWRGRLADKKVLLVLDDAAGYAQIGPLLPGTAGCLVLVTSRRRLIALDGAQPLALDTLPPDQAVEMFTRLARRPAGDAASSAVAELARLCGYLPLAIALLAGRLASHPGWDIARLAADFAATRDRLPELAAGDRLGDPAVAGAFEMSYRELPPGRQRLFRLLGLHPGPDIDAYAAAALARVPLTEARRDLDALYGDHLIDEPASGRYSLHDLIREYARTLAVRNDSADVPDQAIGRLLDYYQHTAQTADRHLARDTRPGPTAATTAPAVALDLPGRAAAMAWMRKEQANLLACIGDATIQAQQPGRIIALTAAMAAFLLQEGPWQQAAAIHHTAAATARHLGDRLGEAHALHDLGRVRHMTGDYPAAAGLHERALALYHDLGSRLGEAHALRDLGRVRYITGDYPAAAGLHERALALYQELGDRLGEAHALHDLGRVRSVAGDFPAAASLLQRTLALYQELGDRLGEANALHDLGRARYMTEDFPAAASLQERALALYRELGDRLGEAHALHDLGRVRYMTGDYPAAAGLHERALALYHDLGSRLGEANALHDLGRVRSVAGDYLAAASLLQRALALYRELGDRLGEANAFHDLGRVRRMTGDYPAAAGLQEQALALYHDLGDRFGEANAFHDLGRVRHMTGDFPAAADLLQRALTLFQEVGDVQGEAEVLNSTGALVAQSTGPREALVLYQQALQFARQVHSPLDEAQALEGAARCAARMGNQAAALTDLTEAVTIYRRIGAAEAETATLYLTALEDEVRDDAIQQPTDS